MVVRLLERGFFYNSRVQAAYEGHQSPSVAPKDYRRDRGLGGQLLAVNTRRILLRP